METEGKRRETVCRAGETEREREREKERRVTKRPFASKSEELYSSNALVPLAQGGASEMGRQLLAEQASRGERRSSERERQDDGESGAQRWGKKRENYDERVKRRRIFV